MKKSILFATPKNSSFTQPISAGLRELGFDVFLFDYLKPDIVSQTIGFGSNLLASIRLRTLYAHWVNYRLLETVSHLSPDYLFVIKGETISARTIDTIKTRGISTINWFPDNVGSWHLVMQTARSYDHYASVCHYLSEKLNESGRKTLYLPVADIADKFFVRTKKKYNLVFAGHKTRKRELYFSIIKDLGFDLWGYPHWKDSILAPHYHGYLEVREMKQMFRLAKIVVNVSTAEEGIPISIANLKNFEATGVGTFVLSEFSPALAELFVENKEMVFFRTKEELRKKAIYYLNHDYEREKIALAGWRRTKKDHTYNKRLTKLFNYTHLTPV